MGFNDNQKEYIIEDMFPKRPLINYIWNEKYIAAINQFGCGKGQAELENHFWHNMVREGDSRHIFIKSSGEIYSANRNYNNLSFDVFKTVVGMGYSKVISEYKGIRSELTILVPKEGMRECWRLILTNTSEEEKCFDVYAYADINAQLTGHLSCNISDFNAELNGICMTHNIYESPSEYHMVHFATNAEVVSYETADRRFFGVYGDRRNPQELEEECLSSMENCYDSGTPAVLHTRVCLYAGESRELYFTVGVEKNIDDVIAHSKEAVTGEYFDRSMCYISEQAAKYDERVFVKTPDDEVNRFTNIWLKRQMELGKTWGRVYNKGFRDIMQDISGFTQLSPVTAREKILDCIQYQKEDGNTLRSWVPLDLTPYRDGAVWLLSTVVVYIKETADKSILDERVSYWNSEITETVFEHCIRGIDFLHRETGEHGLCLWGGGDWNDSFDGAGLEMKGESVWLSIAAVKSTNDFIELLKWLDNNELAEHYTQMSIRMKENINKYGFDTDHYIYGINDKGEIAGSYSTDEGQIFLNPQAWAVMAGITDKPQELLDLVERELSCDFGYVQQKPCYTRPNPNFGRITYFGKGLYENGSCYNHGTAFKLIADCIAGRADNAYRTLKRILPQNELNDYTKSGVEPYALSNMYLGPENTTRRGEAPMSWITGTSGWVFKAVTEFILGVKAEFEGLRIYPLLPPKWSGAEIRREYRGAIYDIAIIVTGTRKLYADGKECVDFTVPDFRDGKVHSIKAEI